MLPYQTPSVQCVIPDSPLPTPPDFNTSPCSVDEHGWPAVSPAMLDDFKANCLKFTMTSEQLQRAREEYCKHDEEVEVWRQSQSGDDGDNDAEEAIVFEPVDGVCSHTDDAVEDQDEQERRAADFERAERLVMHCLRNPKLFEDARSTIGPSQFTAIDAWGLSEIWGALRNVVDEFGIEVMQGDAWKQRCEAELRRHIKHPPNQVDYLFGNAGMPESGLLHRAFTPPASEFPESQGRWLLQQFCTSSLLIAKLERLLRGQDLARKDPKVFTDQVLRVVEDYEKIGGPQGQSMFMSPEEFAAKEFKLDWLIPNILVEGQPCIAGGPSKGMKTSVMIDLAVSLGVGDGTRFLDRFPIPKPGKRVGFISGESGGATIKETFLRVCKARGVELAKCNVYPEFKLPKLSQPQELRRLTSFIRQKQLQVLIIDPIYLSLLAGNLNVKPTDLFGMGPLLSSITEACLDAGATPIMVHHTVKRLGGVNGAGAFDPIDREDLAMSGFSEFARQWLLINRRQPFEDGSGKHQLWLRVGGSVGFSSLWAVDIFEGKQREDFQGRTWMTTVQDLSALKVVEAQKQEHVRAEKKLQRDQEIKQRLFEALQLYPNGETATTIRDAAGIPRNTPVISHFEQLVLEGKAQRCTVKKGNGQEKDGYKPMTFGPTPSS